MKVKPTKTTLKLELSKAEAETLGKLWTAINRVDWTEKRCQNMALYLAGVLTNFASYEASAFLDVGADGEKGTDSHLYRSGLEHGAAIGRVNKGGHRVGLKVDA